MGSAARQVSGPEPPPLSVTGHGAHTCECQHCGAETRADFLEDVTAPTQYDDGIGVLAAYLQTQHCIPENRLAQVFADISGVRITSATLGRLIDRKAKRMSRFADAVKNLLSGSRTAVKHLDETGFGIVGRTRWLHMLCSTSLSHLRLGACRGEVPPTLAGTAVHDCWPANFKVENVRHGLCNAHILRGPQSLVGYGKEVWASDMKTVLRDALKLTHVARSQGRSGRVHRRKPTRSGLDPVAGQTDPVGKLWKTQGGSRRRAGQPAHIFQCVESTGWQNRRWKKYGCRDSQDI